MTDSAAGWQPDPTGKHDHRYWDGSQWTDHVADAGVAGTDPYEAVGTSGAGPLPGPEEPTVVTPVAEGDTTSYPTAPAPPPYVPPSPVADGGGSGGGRRGLVIGGAILAVMVLAVIAFLALGADDDDEPTDALGDRVHADDRGRGPGRR